MKIDLIMVICSRWGIVFRDQEGVRVPMMIVSILMFVLTEIVAFQMLSRFKILLVKDFRTLEHMKIKNND